MQFVKFFSKFKNSFDPFPTGDSLTTALINVSVGIVRRSLESWWRSAVAYFSVRVPCADRR